MNINKHKGNLAEIKIASDLLSRKFNVAFPYGEDFSYDLILIRDSKTFERIQCKYVKSNGKVIKIPGRRLENKNIKYSTNDIDWLACYDETTNKCYYVPSKLLGEGKSSVWLRLILPDNNQSKKINWAKNFEVI